MTRSLTTYTVGTISEYHDAVYEIFEQWKTEIRDRSLSRLWFRGQCLDNHLLPRVLRKVVNLDTGKVCSYNELFIRTAFSSLYRNYTSERFQENSSEFYSFMQHYGIPTRLLDWTENGILALYFAVDSHDDAERVVWVMNPGAINQLTTGRASYAPLVSDVPFVQARMRMVGYIKDGKLIPEFKTRESAFAELSDECLKFPIAFYPASSGNIRIATQKGCFTIHGTAPQPIESFFDNTEIQKYLIKVKILKKSIASIREQLRIMGVTARSVYPDIFGLATELNGPEYMRPDRN